MEVEIGDLHLYYEESESDRAIRWNYKGDVDDKGKRSGQGVLEYMDSGVTSTSIILEGNWQGDVLHDYGVLRVNGTRIYAGNWFNGHIMQSGSIDIEGAYHTEDEMKLKDKGQDAFAIDLRCELLLDSMLVSILAPVGFPLGLHFGNYF